MYKVLDLFSGCGGLSEGFLQANFDVAVSVELDKQACETQRKNHPDTLIINDDLTILSPEMLAEQSGTKDFDLIIGGPPCQGFSLIGTRLGTSKSFGQFGEDPRNKLYKEFVKYVRYFQPKMFLMENVPGLFSMHKGAIKEDIESDFALGDPDGNYLGYSVKSQILKGVDFGVPQNRERVIFIGVRKDIKIDFSHPDPVYEENDYHTVRDAIEDLPSLDIRDGEYAVKHLFSRKNKYLELINSNAVGVKRDNDYQKGYLFNHTSRFHNERDRKLFELLKPFQKLKELEPDLVPIRLRNGFDDFYRKMDFDKPSPTIIAHLYKDGLAFIHPDSRQARSISVREAARLQSFPDNFVFVGPQSATFKQIGNAVPPLLAYHLAIHIRLMLDEISATQEVLLNC